MMQYLADYAGHLYFDHWIWTHRSDMDVCVDGVLVVPVFTDIYWITACGHFRCARCNMQNDLSISWWDHGLRGIVCLGCANMYPDVSVMKVMVPHDSMEFPKITESVGNVIEYVDRRDIEEIKAYADHFCSLVAKVHGMIYYKGKNAHQIYEEMLAKRSVRRWKSVVCKRRCAMLFRVLYNNTGIGIDASMACAKSAKC